MSKIMMAAAAGAGYVLGSRAGRGHYDAIAAKATSLWQDGRVQERADQAQQLVRQKSSELQDKAADLVPSRGGSHAGTSGSRSSAPHGSTAAGSTGPTSTPPVTPSTTTPPTTQPATPPTSDPGPRG